MKEPQTISGCKKRHLQHRRGTLRTVLIVTGIAAAPALLSANPDADWLRLINTHRMTALDNFFRVITDSAPWLAFVVPALLMIRYFVSGDHQKGFAALVAEASVGIAALISTILKFWIDRPRPFATLDFIEKLSTGGSPSFPSGHTTDAFALAIVLTLMLRRWWIALPAFIWAALVGYSRMHLGVHYPSDVAAGILIGIITGGVSYRLLIRLFKKRG